jgi:hypothetical protein
VTPSGRATEPRARVAEGRGEFNLSTSQIILEAGAPGRIATDLVGSFVRSRAAAFGAVNFSEDGTLASFNPMQLPWTVCLGEATLPPETRCLIGAGPQITWLPWGTTAAQHRQLTRVPRSTDAAK